MKKGAKKIHIITHKNQLTDDNIEYKENKKRCSFHFKKPISIKVLLQIIQESIHTEK